MRFNFNLSKGQGHTSDQPGRNFDAPTFLRELSNHLSEPATQAELISLTRERDPELLGAALRSFAGRQENRGRSEVAAAIYERMSESPQEYGVAESRLAGERLQALRGHGSFGARAEIFAQNFAQSVTDPANLLGMAFAGGVFQGIRLASYARLLASPTANVLTRGLGARGLSWGLAFLAEAPAFSLGIRSTNALMGRSQAWSTAALGHELAASYLTLGALRVSGAGGEFLFRRFNPAGGLFSRGLVQQATMFTGITAATWLEQQSGLRPHTDGASLLASSLASLIHFNAVGRILHGLPGNEMTQRLRFQQERLENLPPPSSEAVRGWILPGRTPALAGAENVFMSAIDGSPSTPPPPAISGGETRARRSSAPPPPTSNIKDDITEVERVLGTIFDSRAPGLPWIGPSHRVSRIYSQVLERVRVEEERSANPRMEIINHLNDLSVESEIISRLLASSDHALSSTKSPAPGTDLSLLGAEQHLVGQFLEQFYRSANTFNNFLDNTATIPQSLLHLRASRFWLQHGVERATIGEPIGMERPSDFPYVLTADGAYAIPPKLDVPEAGTRHIIIVGDERGPRTYELLSEGNEVTHVEFDNSQMRITQRLTELRVNRAKDSGQWRAILPSGAKFRSRISDADPANYVEAYFPILFEALKPRSDARRMEQLRELIATNITIKLADEGSAFVISTRHDAIEDLAQAVQQLPNCELLELRIIQNRAPLRAGMDVTSIQGETLYSWLVFRKRGE